MNLFHLAKDSAFSFHKGTLYCEDQSLAALAKKHGTPFYAYSQNKILGNLRTLQSQLSPLPVLICYAVKACPNLSILRLLSQNGAGMDIVTVGELFRALCAGAPAQKIVFSGVGKSRSEIATALKANILSFNVESEEELNLIHDVAAEQKKIAHISLRFNPDIDAKTHPYISTGLKQNKFGIQRKAVLQIAESMTRLKWLKLNGLSIHIGSQLLDLAPLDEAFLSVKLLSQQVAKIMGRPIQQVDLGGGLGISYTGEKASSLEAYCRLVKKHFMHQSAFKKIIIEPGRVMIAEAGALVTEVIYRKAHAKKDFLVADAGMNDLIRPALYQATHPVLPVQQKHLSSPRHKTDLVGPVCESSDCFFSEQSFPKSVGSGDLLALMNAGAYGFSMSSQYNSRPRVPEILVDGKKSRVIRKRETLEDLIEGEV